LPVALGQDAIAAAVVEQVDYNFYHLSLYRQQITQ
jgi:hypothetical protein